MNVKFSISHQKNDFGNKFDLTLKEPPSRDRDRFFISDFFSISQGEEWVEEAQYRDWEHLNTSLEIDE